MHGFTGGHIHGRNVQADGKPVKEYDTIFRAKSVMLPPQHFAGLHVLASFEVSFSKCDMIALQGPNSDSISNNPDFSSILKVGSKLFGVTHYESPTPGVAYLSEYVQNPKTGALKVILPGVPCP